MHIAHEGGKGGPGLAHRKFCLIISCPVLWDSLVAQLVKNLHAIQETWVWSLDQEDPLEKEMASHFSILAWEILWTEEPGRLQSMCHISHYFFLSYFTGYGLQFKKKKKMGIDILVSNPFWFFLACWHFFLRFFWFFWISFLNISCESIGDRV